MMSTTNLPESKQPEAADQGGGLNPLWVGLAIFLFFPLGLYLLWMHPVLSRNKAWWWVGGGWSLIVLIAAMNGEEPPAKEPVVAEAAPRSAADEAKDPVNVEDGAPTGGEEKKEVKTYKVSKGWGRGSVTIELPRDYDIGLDLSDFKYKDYFLNFTAFWRADRSDKPMRHWEAIDSEGVVVDSGNLFFTSIRSYTPTRGRISLPPENWKKAEKIVIH
jgi:hypothetical protein